MGGCKMRASQPKGSRRASDGMKGVVCQTLLLWAKQIKAEEVIMGEVAVVWDVDALESQTIP